MRDNRALRALLLIMIALSNLVYPALAEESLESDVLGVQIPWTPEPVLYDNEQSPQPEEIWTPDEEVLSGAYSAETLIAGGVGERILMRGMQGEDVAYVQNRLHELGYLSGEADGRYGRQTEQAVLKFQRRNGLNKVDGKAGSETLNRLFSRDALEAELETPVPPEEAETGDMPVIIPTPQALPSPTPPLDLKTLSFPAEMAEVFIGEKAFSLPVVYENERVYYPLSGLMTNLGYHCEIQDGSWVYQARQSDTVMILGSETDGIMEFVMGSVGNALFMEEESAFAGQREIWVGSRLLRRLGLCIVEKSGVYVIWKP